VELGGLDGDRAEKKKRKRRRRRESERMRRMGDRSLGCLLFSLFQAFAIPEISEGRLDPNLTWGRCYLATLPLPTQI
jgi:hypothetical protein